MVLVSLRTILISLIRFLFSLHALGHFKERSQCPQIFIEDILQVIDKRSEKVSFGYAKGASNFSIFKDFVFMINEQISFLT